MGEIEGAPPLVDPAEPEESVVPEGDHDSTARSGLLRRDGPRPAPARIGAGAGELRTYLGLRDRRRTIAETLRQLASSA
jgi:hypothetical protein